MKGIFLNAEFYNQKWRKYQTDGLIHFYQGEEKRTLGESKLPNTGILLCQNTYVAEPLFIKCTVQKTLYRNRCLHFL